MLTVNEQRLFLEIANGEGDIASILDQDHVNIDCQNKNGQTLVYIAACIGNMKAIEVLHKYGADITLPDKYGQSPIHAAAAYAHLDVIELLVEKGADVNKSVNDGISSVYVGATPIFVAAYHGNVNVINLLVEKGADVHKAMNDGTTALDIANRMQRSEAKQTLEEIIAEEREFFNIISKGEEYIASIMEKGNFNINSKDRYGQTFVYIAACEGNVKVIEVLHKYGANITLADKYGQSPIHAASAYGHIEVVNLLIEKGANVNTAMHNGSTSVYIAAKYDHVEVINLLVEKGANVNQVNNDGETPLQVATTNGHTEVIQALKAIIANEKSSQNKTNSAIPKEHKFAVVENQTQQAAVKDSQRVNSVMTEIISKIVNNVYPNELGYTLNTQARANTTKEPIMAVKYVDLVVKITQENYNDILEEGKSASLNR